MAIAEVNITGLKELRRALNKVDKTIAAELREGLKDSVNIISADVRAHIPKNTGRAAASVRAVSRGNTIYLVGGKASVPYFGWLDFGGQLPDKRPNTKKALAWSGLVNAQGSPKGVMSSRGAYRPVLKQGRYIYPGVERNMPKVIDAAGDAFDSSARKAGLK